MKYPIRPQELFMQEPATLLPSADMGFRLSVTYRPIDELKPDPANPRLHSKKQIRQIANTFVSLASMHRFRFWSIATTR